MLTCSVTIPFELNETLLVCLELFLVILFPNFYTVSLLYGKKTFCATWYPSICSMVVFLDESNKSLSGLDL